MEKKMINMFFIACTACFTPKQSSFQLKDVDKPSFIWECNYEETLDLSIVTIKEYDCSIIDGSVNVEMNQNQTKHYHFEKTRGCEFPILFISKSTKCEEIKSISLLNKHHNGVLHND